MTHFMDRHDNRQNDQERAERHDEIGHGPKDKMRDIGHVAKEPSLRGQIKASISDNFA